MPEESRQGKQRPHAKPGTKKAWQRPVVERIPIADARKADLESVADSLAQDSDSTADTRRQDPRTGRVSSEAV